MFCRTSGRDEPDGEPVGGAERPVVTQRLAAQLDEVLSSSTLTSAGLRRLAKLGLPDWYLGAGVVAQTVWNHAHGFDSRFGIRDVDLVYFDPTDLTEQSERKVEELAVVPG